MVILFKTSSWKNLLVYVELSVYTCTQEREGNTENVF